MSRRVALALGCLSVPVLVVLAGMAVAERPGAPALPTTEPVTVVVSPTPAATTSATAELPGREPAPSRAWGSDADVTRAPAPPERDDDDEDDPDEAGPDDEDHRNDDD